MIQIGDVVVSFDVLREKFLCDLDACQGICCIEGDAGAPVELDEVEKLEEVLPLIWDELSPEARTVIEEQGVVYTDCEGDLVTSIVNNKDCVFTCYDDKGCCYCAIEKAYREGRTNFYKPISCHLYPIRVGNYGLYKAVNYHRWDVCKAAILLKKKVTCAYFSVSAMCSWVLPLAARYSPNVFCTFSLSKRICTPLKLASYGVMQ